MAIGCMAMTIATARARIACDAPDEPGRRVVQPTTCRKPVALRGRGLRTNIWASLPELTPDVGYGSGPRSFVVGPRAGDAADRDAHRDALPGRGSSESVTPLDSRPARGFTMARWMTICCRSDDSPGSPG